MSLAYDPKVEELESKAMSAWVSIGFAPKDGTVVDLWVDYGYATRSLTLPSGQRFTDCKWVVPEDCMGAPDWCRWYPGRRFTSLLGSNKAWKITHYSLPLPGPNT